MRTEVFIRPMTEMAPMAPTDLDLLLPAWMRRDFQCLVQHIQMPDSHHAEAGHRPRAISGRYRLGVHRVLEPLACRKFRHLAGGNLQRSAGARIAALLGSSR